MAEKKRTKSQKHSFFVPDDDHYTNDWLDAQTSLSVSIRMLIHQYVAAHGYTDMIFGDMATGTIRSEAVSASEAPQKPFEAPSSVQTVNPPAVHETSSDVPQNASHGTPPDDFHDENGDLNIDELLGRL